MARKDKDDSRVKSEDEIWVKIEAKILEVEEDAFLDASKNLDGSPGVIPDSQASILLNALTREEGSGLLSAPEVTVKNGEEAKIQVVQEFVFPTGKPSTQVTGEGDGGDEHPDLVQEVGIQLSVTPTVQKNNQIDLTLDAKVTKLDGFVEQNKGIPMPIFSERKVTTQVTLSDGATAIIGVLTRKEEKTVNDKISGLTKNKQKRKLLIFVSANIASAEGSPVRENLNRKLEELKAEQDPFTDPFAKEVLETEQKLNEQLDKANKKLDEIIAVYNQLNGESPKSSKVEMIKTEQKLNEQLNKANKRLAKIIALMNQLNGESPKSSKVEIIGIGAKLIDVNGSCTIAELIPGGPAEKSQLLEPKDVILKVSKSDGTLADISDMKLSEIVELIKGPKNSKVKLLIQPFKNPATLKEISIKRKPFHIYHQTHENKVSERLPRFRSLMLI